MANIQTHTTTPSKPGGSGDGRVTIKPGIIASAKVEETSNRSIQQEGKLFSDEDVDFVTPDEAKQIANSAQALGL